MVLQLHLQLRLTSVAQYTFWRTRLSKMTPGASWLLPVFVPVFLSFISASDPRRRDEISKNNNSLAYTYTVLAPKIIRPFSAYQVSVNIEPRHHRDGDYDASLGFGFNCTLSDSVVVIASILDVNKTKLYSSDPVTIQLGRNTFVNIAVGDLGSAYSCYVGIKGYAVADSRFLEPAQHIFKEVSTTGLRVIHKTPDSRSAVFVHTDKPIYKPGETVRFRVIVLDGQLKPYKSGAPPLVNVTIFDPRGNVIKIWRAKPVSAGTGGIFSSNLTLSFEPVLGSWEIHTEVQTQEQVCQSEGNSSVSHCDSVSPYVKTKRHSSFSVEQYVLPKFFVELVLPPFATYNNSRITVQVKASYTYGKPVGTARVVLTISETYAYRGDRDIPTFTKTLEIQNGIAFVDFDLVKELLRPSLKGSYREEDSDEDHGVSVDVDYEISRRDRWVIFKASVTESLTGARQNASSIISIRKHAYELVLAPGLAHTYKPGLPLTITIRVSTQDGLPVHDPAPDALTVKHGLSWTEEDGLIKAPVPASGLVRVTFQTPPNEQFCAGRFEVEYKGVRESFNFPDKVVSESRTYLQLSLDGDVVEEYKVQAGQDLQVRADCNKAFNAIYYQLVGKGEHLYVINGTNNGKKTLSTPSNTTLLQVRIPATLFSPQSSTLTLIVYMYYETEIVSDSMKFTIESKLNNNLTIRVFDGTGTGSVEPGQNVTLELRTKPGSVVALRAVDQSVLLIGKQDTDMDSNSVKDELRFLDDYSSSYYGARSRYGRGRGSDSSRVFGTAGLVLLTNAKMHKPKGQDYSSGGGWGGWGDQHYGYGWGNYHHGGGGSKKAQKAKKKAAAEKRPDVRVRTHFPETWFWEEVDGDGPTVLTKTVPDTLTSWLITGYSIHPESGLGLLDGGTQKLTVVRPFFITLNIPASAVSGEVLAVQVLVHNYLDSDHDAEVTVTLDNSRHQFGFFGTEPNSDQPNFKAISVQVSPSTVGTATFVIVPTQFGPIELAVKATALTDNSMAGDALSRPLLVKPPGQVQSVNKVVLLNLVNAKSSTMTLETVFSPVRVPGTDQIRLSVVSDILGPFISNLDSLLAMPHGCGEQNLAKFVPDILVLDYLTKIGRLTPEIKAKAIDYLETGYQRQLTYAHNDGSFSAFGRRDGKGSTWLTAFTIKSFQAAKPWITVDDEVIAKGLRFLARKQSSKRGYFRETGRVLQSGLQGGSSAGKGIALTAYVLLTFLETNKNSTRHQSVIDKGLEYLASQATAKRARNSRDDYGLVLSSYVLELANHPARTRVSALVDKYARVGTDDDDGVTKPNSIEMASYRLLAYLASSSKSQSQPDLTTVLPLVKWLLAQRNAAGGFISTQDTVVGLTALAKFASLTHDGGRRRELSLDISATPMDAKNMALTDKPIGIHIGEGNAIVFQSFELPNTTRTVKLEANGSGMALVQLTSTFYVESTANDSQKQSSFIVDVKLGQKSKMNHLELNICTKFKSKSRSKSNMAVLEVNLPTGYQFDDDSAQWDKLRSLPKVMRVDSTEGDTQLNIYYDSLSSVRSCVSLSTNLVHRVENQSPAYVRVYDYYDPSRSSGVASYEAPKLKLCTAEAKSKTNEEVNGENCI